MSDPASCSPRIDIVRIFVWAVLGILVVVGSLSMISSRGSRTPSKVWHCRQALERIGQALREYHDHFGSFPPAYIADADGTPIHSWRVLILPYLGDEYHYRMYNFDEPWDGPGNILLAKSPSPYLFCPAAKRTGDSFTDYVAITGPGTVFDGTKTCSLGEIEGDPARVIMLTEVARSDIPWTAPRDLSIEQLNLTINADGHGISSNHSGGANVLHCKGRKVTFGNQNDQRDYPRANFLPNTTTAEQLKSMLQFSRKEH